MAWKFGDKSEAHLKGVHPDLVRVCRRALELSLVDFAIVDGVRTPEEQEVNLKTGASQTKNSRHLTGHAVDVMAYQGAKGSWDYYLYIQIAEAFKMAAAELAVAIIWGGDWKTLKDGGHFELDRGKYP